MLALFRRNAWANQRLLDFCMEQPAEVVGAPADGDVYGGIDALLTHIVASECGYVPLITGKRREKPVGHEQPLPLDDLREPATWAADRWQQALDLDRDPDEVLQYQRGRDPEWMTDWLPLVQCIHHGDDHRNQVATVLTRHGIQPPDLDCWAYAEATASDDPADEIGRTDRRDAVLRRAFGHHFWATEVLLGRCLELPPDKLALSAPGTYGSILDTLDHMVSSDRSYLSRLRGGDRLPPLNAGAVGPLLEHFVRASEDWRSYLDSKPDFNLPIRRRDGGSVPAWVVVMQAIHHGNDHRTHVGTALMNSKLPCPELGAWEYGFAIGALQILG